MKRKRRNLVLLTVFVSSMAFAGTQEPRTFSGHYDWDAQDLSGNLEAVFTPTGESTWDVSFHFTFQGPHTYVGTAEGNLVTGKLEGTVVNERETRTFDFSGTVKKGKFRGTHYESTNGARSKTGTMSLKAVD